MNFNRHSELRGQHAFLSPSNPSWLRYDNDKMKLVYLNHKNIARGTELHEFAAKAIELGVTLGRSNRTLNHYINDAIRYGLTPEQMLYYSRFCFGTADAIQLDKNILRIFDLKTGFSKPHREQLEIYAALFCLEYGIKPKSLNMDLRIYQSDDVDQWTPEVEDIEKNMEIIKNRDILLNKLELGVI